MDAFEHRTPAIHRRAFLGRAPIGLGSVALASLLDPGLLAGGRGAGEPPRRPRGAGDPPPRRWAGAPGPADPWRRPRGAVDPPHVRPRAKRAIFLYMAGGPSQFETF